MIDSRSIKDYLSTQNLSVSITDIQVTLAQLNAIFSIEKEQLLAALGKENTTETETHYFDSGTVDLNKIIAHLHPQVDQSFLFLQFFALLDSVNNEQKNAALSLYLALRKNTEEEQSMVQKENLGLCMNAHFPKSNCPITNTQSIPNIVIKQVGLTGWGHVIDDATAWLKFMPEVQEPITSGSHIVLPIYTPDETLLGVLHAHNHEKHFFTPEKQAPLIALVLFFSEKLKDIHWQMLQ